MDELLNQISAELSKNDNDPVWISVMDLDYACGQMKEKISREKRPHARTRNTRVARRHHSRHTRHEKRTHQKTRIGTYKIKKRRLQS